MRVIHWEPFRDLDDIFDRFVADTLRRQARPAGQPNPTYDWAPVADVTESDAEYLIKAELPEVAKEDVKVTVDENVITISGERRKEAEQKDEKVHRIESFYGRFTRSFRLPEDADVTAIQAQSKDGVLKVRVPKTPAPKPRTVEVQVN